MSNINKLKLSDFPFHHETKTRWRDLDAFGHVNNATFLSYIEDARITFFTRWHIGLKEKSLIVAAAKIDYLKQLKHPSKIIIGQKVSRLGTKSFDIESAIFINKIDGPVCHSTITSVCYNFLKAKPVPLYDEIIKDYKIK